MIYTIGKTDLYERYFAEQPRAPKKAGRKGTYPGGSVWESREIAQSHCPDEFSVYGVMAVWGEQTAPSLGGGDQHDLLVDADLVKLEGETS